jgi:tripartite ATP-independent transporter DctM subunit
MVMLIYGIMADVSIGKLFIAGIVPGVFIAMVFSGFIIVRALKNPMIAPRSKSKYTWNEKLRSIPLLLPVICLITTVLGSIYTGWATPTEAAAVGSLASLVFAFISKSMTLKGFKEALMGAVRTNAMVMLIMVGAGYLSVVVGYLGITRGLSQFVSGLGLSPYLLMAILSLMYLMLGCLVDGFSMIVMTTPIILPLVTMAGFDPIWFGIFLVIMIEVAQITPPVGFNLFVLKGLTGMSIGEVAVATMPFFLLLVFVAGVITVFPQIVLYLPNLMIQ